MTTQATMIVKELSNIEKKVYSLIMGLIFNLKKPYQIGDFTELDFSYHNGDTEFSVKSIEIIFIDGKSEVVLNLTDPTIRLYLKDLDLKVQIMILELLEQKYFNIKPNVYNKH